MGRSVTRDNLGAWLLKVAPRSGSDLVASIEQGGDLMTSRCVVRGYRSELMAEHDRVLLWVSGDGRRLARGIWGVGRLLGPAEESSGLSVPMALTLLDVPVTAGELIGLGVDDLEVQRMPAGPNPSWVSREQLARVDLLLPD